MDIQKLVDAMGEAGRIGRGNYHLTLGKAIAALAALPAETPVRYDVGGAPGEADSYRGYYSDLALEPEGGLDTAGKLLAELTAANGKTFEGYKGGDFRMEDNTPLWMATYGTTSGSLAITDLQVDAAGAVLITREVD